MGGWRKYGFPAFLAAFGALLIILPSAMLYLRIPLGGYELVVEDDLARLGPEGRRFYFGPYPPVDLDVPIGLLISDAVARVEKGNITSMEFNLGVSNGFPPVDLCSTGLTVSGVFYEHYYFYSDRNLSLAVLKDPDGMLARRLLNQNASVRVQIANIKTNNQDRHISLRFNSVGGQGAIFSFMLPPFLTDPPMVFGTADAITIEDIDGSYHRPSADDQNIREYTFIENRTFSLDHNLTILKNGTLELRNSTIFLNMSPAAILEGLRLFTINYTFNASEQSGPFIDALADGFQARNISFYRYSMYLHGLQGDFWEIREEYGNEKYLLEMHNTTVDVYRELDDAIWLRRGLYVGTGATLLILNSTVHVGGLPSPINMTSFWHSNIDFEIYGSARMENSSFLGPLDGTPTAMDIRSSDVLVEDNRIGIPVNCRGCSPQIINNSLGDRPGTELGIEYSSALVAGNRFNGSGGISIKNRSYPQIIQNHFFNESGTIDVERYSGPVILNNTFWNSTTGIRIYSHCSAEIAGNVMIKAKNGIFLNYMSKVDIHDNDISANRPVEIAYLSSAEVKNNIFRDYEHYGVYSYLSTTDLGRNRFVPGGNGTTETLGAAQEWILYLRFLKESCSQRESASPGIRLVSAGPLNKDERIDTNGRSEYADAGITEFQVSDQGERKNASGYRLLVDYQWWHYEIAIDSGRSQEYTIILKEKAHDSLQLLSLIVLGILSISMATYPPVDRSYSGWKWRRHAFLSSPVQEPRLPAKLRKKLWWRMIYPFIALGIVLFLASFPMTYLAVTFLPVLALFYGLAMMCGLVIAVAYVYSIWQQGAEFLGITPEEYADYKAAYKDLIRRWRANMVPPLVAIIGVYIVWVALSLTVPDGFFRFNWLLAIALFVLATALVVKREKFMKISYCMYGFDPKKTFVVMILLFVLLGVAVLAISMAYIFF